MQQLVVDCSDVSFFLNGVSILEKINLQLYKSTITTIIGPNGGGKTTLGKIISGALVPTCGVVKREKKLKFGYMPQKVHLNHLMPITSKQFLLLSLNKKINRDGFVHIVQQQKIDHLLNKQLHELSGGELQRILFSRLLVSDPDVMVLDEPTEGLDVVGQKEFYFNIEQLRSEQKKTILLISHDLYTVMSGSNHVFCLDKVICCSGLPEAVSKNKHYEKMFNNQQQENIFSFYKHSHKE